MTPSDLDDPTTADEAASTDTESETQPELATQLAILNAENEQLREEYLRARQNTYRNAAIALGAIGVGSLFGGILFPAERTVFITLGAIGVFAAALTYYLTPGQFVDAAVGEQIYAANAHNWERLSDELGLQSERVYLPGNEAVPAYLFVPLYGEYELPRENDRVLVLDDGERGLLLAPTGSHLVRQFHNAAVGGPADTPGGVAQQLADALVEQFELAHQATPDVDGEDARITVSITRSAFGDIDRFDHPIPSFLGSGLAATLDQTVSVRTTAGDGRADWVVSCRLHDAPPTAGDAEE